MSKTTTKPGLKGRLSENSPPAVLPMIFISVVKHDIRDDDDGDDCDDGNVDGDPDDKV